MTRLVGVEQTRGRLAGPPLTPRTAVIWSVLRAELDRRGDTPLTVLDVGGGTGGFAVPLAHAGHRVTVVDASPDALAALTRRAAEAGRPRQTASTGTETTCDLRRSTSPEKG
ncbi:methyltransferase domain-containing protein, partial [Micromonospora sp. NPDC049799]|uniref:class I SAM-dependent methyltransferase n=1 Tax=Micromonospora sp. NPDC049799 TaxID=3154741 RepID=UPI003408FEEF